MTDFNIAPAVATKPDHADLDDSFSILNSSMNQGAFRVLRENKHIAFKARLGRHELFDAFLAAFPEETRQEHNCNCCRDFLRVYGDLITVEEDGTQKSVLWDEELYEGQYQAPIRAMRQLVEAAKIDKVFYTHRDQVDLGIAQKGGYIHFCLLATHFHTGPSMAKAVGAQMLDTKQDYIFLKTSVQEFSQTSIELAIKLFTDDVQLKHYPRHLANLQWLSELRAKVKHSPVSEQLIWREVATQPPGRVRLKNTVMGEFLKALDEGTAVNIAKRAFLAMVDPKDYLRPKAAPAAGNIEQAERIVKSLGIERSLERRWARLEDIPAAVYKWAPTVPETPIVESSVFGHLAAKFTDKVAEPGVIDGGKLTWERFEADVMPAAKSIELFVDAQRRDNFATLVTAVHADAPPIHYWDSPDARNPVSAYAYNGGSFPAMWNMPVPFIGARIPVIGVIPQPSQWNEDPAADKDESDDWRMLILKGARDVTGMRHLGLFPANMRKELFEIRATIEAYSGSKGLEGGEDGMAGVVISGGSASMSYRLYVSDGKFTTQYVIDRYK